MARIDHQLRPDFPTIPETNRRSGVGVKRIRRAISLGELPGYDLGGKWARVYWPEFLEWVRKSRVSAPYREDDALVGVDNQLLGIKDALLQFRRAHPSLASEPYLCAQRALTNLLEAAREELDARDGEAS